MHVAYNLFYHHTLFHFTAGNSASAFVLPILLWKIIPTDSGGR